MKDQDLWLHSKTGGVVAGRIVAADRLEITLPGSGVIVFQKTAKEGPQ